MSPCKKNVHAAVITNTAIISHVVLFQYPKVLKAVDISQIHRVMPDPFAYVTNAVDNTVSVINTATNTVIGLISVGNYPLGIAITPDGARAYVTNAGDNTVSVINTATNTVIGSPISVGNFP